jgi:hypothetical protein
MPILICSQHYQKLVEVIGENDHLLPIKTQNVNCGMFPHSSAVSGIMNSLRLDQIRQMEHVTEL